MQQRRIPVILILGTMGSRLVAAERPQVQAWMPTRPLRVLADLDALRCDEHGEPCLTLKTAGCFDKRPLDFVSPLRRSLGRYGLSVMAFPYDWRLSLFRSAELLADWIDARRFELVDIVGVSSGGLVATQYAHMGFADRIRNFVSIGTPFLGMPRALANFHTGAVLNGAADVVFARKARALIRTFPSMYELLPCSAFFRAENHACVDVHGDPLHSHAEMCSWLECLPQISSRLLKTGVKFLAELEPAEALRNVNTSFIVNGGRPTVARVSYRENGTIRILRRTNGDGSVPLISQTIGGENESSRACQTYEFRGRHRTMHLNRQVMEQIARILLDDGAIAGQFARPEGSDGC